MLTQSHIDTLKNLQYPLEIQQSAYCDGWRWQYQGLRDPWFASFAEAIVNLCSIIKPNE